MTRLMSRTAVTLAIATAIAIATALTGCSGAGAPAASYEIVASYYAGGWYPAIERVDAPGVTGPVGTWEFGVIRAGIFPESAGTCGGTDAPGQCTVYEKSGEEVLPGGKNTWDLEAGDYHVVARDELGRKLTETWVFVDPDIGRG